MKEILNRYTAEQIGKAKNIRAIIFDVDGVMTDGSIIYTNTGDEAKKFHVRDGAIIRPLREQGFVVGAITGRNSELMEFRAKELKLDFLFQAAKNKFARIEEMAEKHGFGWSEVCYVGDDFIDMASLKEAGLGAAPSDAPEYVKASADLVTFAKGGEGVVREVADFILAAQDKMYDVIESFTSRR